MARDMFNFKRQSSLTANFNTAGGSVSSGDAVSDPLCPYCRFCCLLPYNDLIGLLMFHQLGQ